MSWPLQGLVASKRWGNTTRRLMALTLSSVANDDGSGIFASVKTMARDSEISESTARRTIQDFEAEGLLSKVGTRPCLNGYTNVWLLNVDAIRAMDDLKPEKKTDDRGVSATGVSTRKRSRAEPGSRRHQTPSTVTDNPIQEPITLAAAPAAPENKTETKRKEPSKGGPITLDLEMTPRMRAFADKSGFLNGSGSALFERFRAHHASKGSMFVSFDAAFQTWVLNELKFNQQRTSNDQRNSDGRGYAARGDRTGMARTSAPPSGRRRSRTMAEAAERLIDELTGADRAGEAPSFGGAPLLTYRPA